MDYIVKADLNTQVYPEIMDVITRSNDALVTDCIGVAIDEAKSYLMRFNLVALFGDYTNQANPVLPTITDRNLKSKIKDMACWHLIKLANPNINLELFRTAYEDAIKFLESVKKSQIAPDGWAYKPDDTTTNFNEGAMVGSSSNIKKHNHW